VWKWGRGREMIKVTLNGEVKEFSDNITIKTIIEKYCRNSENIVAELNRDIIKRDKWQDKELADGDVLELISFMGGG
jgi:thiamine biosynthesis protein ThiS